MDRLQFDAFVTIWKFQHNPLGLARSMRQKGDWTLGLAIRHVIGRPLEDQWRYKIVTGDQVLDHVDVTQMAYTKAFDAWNRNQRINETGQGGRTVSSPSRSGRNRA